MKAEHRHQLQTNVLADQMGRFIQGMKTSPKSTSILAWVFPVLAIAAFGLWQYTAATTQSENAALWSRVDEGTHDIQTGPSILRDVADSNPNSMPGRTSRFSLARLQYQTGQQTLLSSLSAERPEAIGRIEDALKEYSLLVNECADSPLLLQEAMLGVASAEETLIGTKPERDVEVAIKAYQQLVDKFPLSDAARQAEQRIKLLTSKQSEVAKFYQDLNRTSAPKPKMEDTLPEPKRP